jgi:hypothetical protein
VFNRAALLSTWRASVLNKRRALTSERHFSKDRALSYIHSLPKREVYQARAAAPAFEKAPDLVD